MDTGTNIRISSRVSVTVEGCDFLCYRWTAGMALQALGPGALNIDGGDIQVKLSADDIVARYETIKKALGVLMISPRLVEEDTDDPDAVTWQDLLAADVAAPLFAGIVRESQERAANFPEPSEAHTGS